MNTFIKERIMPKIIENVRDKLIEEARSEMLSGADAITVRSIADACGIAVGTFYNYFESKEYLMAVVMLNDWNKIIEKLCSETRGSEPIKGIEAIFLSLRDFSILFKKVWSEGEISPDAIRQRNQRHGALVSQIKTCIEGFITNPNDPYLTEFLAEIIIKFASDCNTDYDDFARMVKKLV